MAGQRGRILVVDDSKTNRLKLSLMLTNQGHSVAEAEGGRKALETLRAESFDLVLLDISMPEMNGFEVCREMKGDEALKAVPVIFISGLSETMDKMNAFSAGGVDYVTKPFQPEEVQARVETHLNLRRLQIALEERNLHLEELVQAQVKEIIAGRTKLAEVERDLTIAADIQESMLPRTFPPFPDRPEIEIFARIRPAREIGGDFYNYYFIDPDRLAVVIGDVSGKGIPAALYMTVSQALLKTISCQVVNPGECLRKLNLALHADQTRAMFVTVFFGVLNTKTGLLRYSMGGHPSPILVRKDHPPAPLPAVGGPVVGLIVDGEFDTGNIQLYRGDTLLLYTDGVTEARDPAGRMFQDTGWLERLLEGGFAALESLVDGVFGDVGAFAGDVSPADDQTILAVRYRK